MKIHTLVLGFGVASNAYVSLLNENNIETTVLGSPFDQKRINQLKKNKKDKVYKIKYSNKINFLNRDEVKLIDSEKVNFIIVGTNTKGLDWAIKVLNKLKINCPVLLITKGLSLLNNKVVTISDYFFSKCFNHKIIMSAGPCLAKELINKAHTRTLFASRNTSFALYAKKILETKYYHPEISNDIQGAEVCAAIKNIYATVIGASVGQVGDWVKNKNQNYFNSSSALFEQSIKEMKLIVKRLGGDIETVSGLAGAGDLYVSVLGGRNSKLGSYLGQGLLYKNIVKKQMKGVTVEGADLTKALGSKILSLISGNKLPLLKSLVNSIKGNKKLRIDWKKFTI